MLFRSAAATLDDLIQAGKSTLESINGYSRNLYFPEDWDAPATVIGPPWTFALKNPCFGEPREMLLDMKDRTQNYISQLEAAKKDVNAMNSRTEVREDQIDQATGTRKPAAKSNAKGTAELNRKKHRKIENTVTGKLHKDSIPDPKKK